MGKGQKGPLLVGSYQSPDGGDRGNARSEEDQSAQREV